MLKAGQFSLGLPLNETSEGIHRQSVMVSTIISCYPMDSIAMFEKREFTGF